MKKTLFLTLALILVFDLGCNKDENYTVKDIDGNVYTTVTIWNQVWMVENLKTSRYRNGDPVDSITDVMQWLNSTSGAWCCYNNNPLNGDRFGYLYNWYAVNDSRNLAPEGWHVATNEEWTILTDNLGGADHAGSKLKAAGIRSGTDDDSALCFADNEDATNVTGFTAYPGGRLDATGQWMGAGESGFWWTSTQSGPDAFMHHLDCGSISVGSGGAMMNNGFYVRCVKDI
jgi:uncharacterized protein (TIGR02145 family)